MLLPKLPKLLVVIIKVMSTLFLHGSDHRGGDEPVLVGNQVPTVHMYAAHTTAVHSELN